MTREESEKYIKSKMCNDCGVYLGGGKCSDNCKVIEAIKSLEQTTWIPVSERLPEENKTVIASTRYRVYPESRYTEEYGWEWAYEAGTDYWVMIQQIVTAWMPLPETYETEREE